MREIRDALKPTGLLVCTSLFVRVGCCSLAQTVVPVRSEIVVFLKKKSKNLVKNSKFGLEFLENRLEILDLV
jgi:hypothetical protein